MAIAHKARYEHSNDHEIRVQVQIAMVKAAIAITAEATDTKNHENRARYATTVLNNPEHYAVLMTAGVVSQLTTANPSDADIDTQIASIWNAYAGVV